MGEETHENNEKQIVYI